MKSPFKKTLKYTAAGLCLAVLLGAFVFIFLPSIYGYPAWVSRKVGKALAPPNGVCEIDSIVGNLFSGFELRDISLSCPSPYGTFHANIPNASLALKPLPFLKGEIKPKTFAVSDSNITLELPADDDSPLESMQLMNLNCNAQCTSYGAVNAKATGIFKEINIAVDANLSDFYELLNTPKNDSQPIPVVNTEAVALLKNISREIAAITNNASDVYMILKASGSFRQPEKINISGTSGFAEAFVKGRFLPKASAKFSYKNAILNFSDLHIFYNASESLWCQATVNLLANSLRCSVQADLMPETIIQILGVQNDYLPAFITFNSPIHIDGEIPETSWQNTLFTPKFYFACNNILLGNVDVPHISGVLKYNDNTIDLQRLLLSFNEDSYSLNDQDSYSLEGNFKMTMNDGMLAGNLAGRIDLGELCRGLDIIDTRETPLAAFTDARIKATLEPSNFRDWRNWSCKFELSQQAGEFAELPVKDISLKLSLNDNSLEMDTSAVLSSDIDNHFSIHARTDVPENLQSSPIVVSVNPKVVVQNETALDISTDLTLKLFEHSISADEGKGTIRPELIWNLMAQPLKFEENNPLSLFKCNNAAQPIEFSFAMPSIYWRNQKESWALNGTKWQISGKTNMTDVNGKEYYDSEKIFLKNVHGTMKDNAAQGNMEIDFWFMPFKMTLKNLDFVGDPSKVVPLTYADKAIYIYEKLWEDFQWETGSEPHVFINNLEFKDLDNDFFFSLDGFAQLKNFRYNEMSIHELKTEIKLELPEGGLDILNASITAPGESDTMLNGHAHMDFPDGVYGNFFIEKNHGTFALIEFLDSLIPPTREHLELFKISPETEFQCHGRFRYANFLTLDLNGTLNTPFLQYRNIQLQNLKGTWRASNRNFFWDFPEAEFYGGILASTGTYDIETKTCDFLARAKEIPLDELLSVANAKLTAANDDSKDKTKSTDQKAIVQKTPGKLDAEGHFRLLKDWAGRPLHLEGDGKAHIYEADLWRIPTLTTLGKILAGGTFNLFSRKSIASLGQITDLKTNFECHGTHVDFQNIRTDGSFIALKGAGQYYLEENALDFQISGQLLKSVSIISLLLRPISWAFDAQLTGTPQDYKWRLRSPIRKLFE
ncbi:MAG: hypothetical protein MJ106_03630 [Lentisphaeria bacterium]|nr:hypothetical protein [Lentisphaeria bacterium]